MYYPLLIRAKARTEIRTSRRYSTSSSTKTDSNIRSQRSTKSDVDASQRKSPSYWANPEARRHFFDSLGLKLGVQTHEDWYKVTKAEITSAGGGALLRRYFSDSISSALQDIYSEHGWKLWKFQGGVPNNYWESRDNRVDFLQTIARELNVQKLEDWYQISRLDVDNLGGGGLLAQFKDSLPLVLAATFSDHQWQFWRFKSPVPRKFWSVRHNRRKFLEYVAESSNLSSFDMWYSGMTPALIEKFGGRSMLVDYHNDSVSQAALELFPEHNWEPWLFSPVPKSLVSKLSKPKLIEFVVHVERQLGIRAPNDWYRTSRIQMKAIDGASALCSPSGVPLLQSALQALHPTHEWDVNQLPTTKSSQTPSTRTNRKASQRVLKSTLADLFPSMQLQEEIRLPPHDIEVDIYVESLRLAFEYQGQQHYDKGVASNQAEVDTTKAARLAKLSITLVEVPFWWDQTKSSLIEMIRVVRPEIEFSKQPS